MPTPKFAIASPVHCSLYDAEAVALNKHDLLRFIAMGTRRGVTGLPADVTRLLPAFGLAAYAAAKTLSVYAAESFRLRMHPWFDRWVLKQLQPGDHIISSYGYANECFKWVRQHGGKTFLDDSGRGTPSLEMPLSAHAPPPLPTVGGHDGAR